MTYRREIVSALCSALLLAFAPLSANAQAKPSVPKEVSDVVGSYTGSWSTYMLDANGQAVKQASWTDTMTATNPVVEGGRAYVTTTDELTFDGGRFPPAKVPGKEGYELNADGTAGAYFIETYGQQYRMVKLGDDVWAYAAAATPQELPRLGAPNPVSAQHVLIKTVTFEGGVETHNISRVTTVRWKDAAGKERTTQFVSLQGQHRRSAAGK